jgi:hypothetical protein
MPALKKKYRITVPIPVPAAAITIQPAFLDVKQSAVYLSATIASTRRWLKKHNLRVLRVGRRDTYRRSDIDRVWNEQAVAA